MGEKKLKWQKSPKISIPFCIYPQQKILLLRWFFIFIFTFENRKIAKRKCECVKNPKHDPNIYRMNLLVIYRGQYGNISKLGNTGG